MFAAVTDNDVITILLALFLLLGIIYLLRRA